MLLLDIGPSMHHILPDIEKICSMLVQKKVSFHVLCSTMAHIFQFIINIEGVSAPLPLHGCDR